jgi:vacuolar-type H+-ATPase subunit F/Vma7
MMTKTVRIAAILLACSVVLVACKSLQNEGGLDWVEVEMSIDLEQPVGHAMYSTTGQRSVALAEFGSALVSAIPATDAKIDATSDFSGAYDRQMMNIANKDVMLTVPLNESMRLAVQGFADVLPLSQALTAVTDGFGLTEAFTVDDDTVSKSLALKMNAVIRETEPENPEIISVTIADEIQVNAKDNPIIFEIQHTGVIEYSVSVEKGTITTPTTGTHNPQNGRLEVKYDAPDAPGEDSITLTVNDPRRTDKVSKTYPIKLVWGPATGNIKVLFGPVAKQIHFWRKTDRLEMEAVTEPESGLTYAWRGTGAFSGLTGTSRTAVIEPYRDTVTGTVTITATDASNISSSLTRTINAGDFPLVTHNPPQITSAQIPDEITAGSTENPIFFKIDYSNSVAYSVTAEHGTVSPSSGTHNPEGGALKLEVKYTAPSYPVEDTISITVNDLASIYQVSKSYRVNVVAAGQAGASTELTVRFGPVAKRMHFWRKTDSLEITVITEPESGLTYAWRGTGAFSGLTGTSRTAVIESFTDSSSGTVTITATDASNISSSLTRTINADDFPLVTNTPPDTSFLIHKTGLNHETSTGH